MPRDGSYTYHLPPGTQGIPDTTIESTKYNSFTADVEQDLNAPRPISAGGTGANNAHDAMIALKGEIAIQQVDNYDSFPFVAGSFQSAPGATSAPLAGAFVSGVCHTYDSSNITLEAVAYGSALPPTKYTRQKYFGVAGGAWQAWTKIDPLLKSGGTITGNLKITDVNPALIINKTGNAWNVIQGSTNDLARWSIFLGDGNAETGGNAGSHFSINRHNDAGTILDSPVFVNRTSGLVSITGAASFSNNVTVTGAISAAGQLIAGNITSALASNTGTYYFGSAQTRYLTFDGTRFLLNGGPLTLAAEAAGAGDAPTKGYVDTQDALRVAKSGDTISGSLTVSGTTTLTGNMFFGPTPQSSFNTAINFSFGGAGVQDGMSFRPNAISGSTNALVFANNANGIIGTINTTATGTAYNVSSDVRLKEDLKSFDAGRIIDDTEVYNFAWKSTGERSYGVSAQQANEVYPEAVTYSEEHDWWGIDYSKYVPVLLQELKALRARVTELEGRLDAKPA